MNALTGIVWVDDEQVDTITIDKVTGEATPGVHIDIVQK